MKLMNIVSLAVGACFSLQALASDYVLKRPGQTETPVHEIKAATNGDLQVVFEKGDTPIKIGAGDYEYAVAPEPARELDLIDKQLAAGNWAKVEELSKFLFDRYQFLSQGGLVGDYWGRALLAQKKYAEALAAYRAIEKVAKPENKIKFTAGALSAQVELGQLDAVKKAVPNLYKAGTYGTAVAFNIQGMVALKEGDVDGAIIQFLKTAKLMENVDEVSELYNQATAQLAALLAQKKDSRAALFQVR